MKKDILSVLDLGRDEVSDLIACAARLKQEKRDGICRPYLERATLGMIFEKASTRTRISFEAGMCELGGHALFLNPDDMQLGRGEEVRDTARVLSRFLSAVMIRAYRHETIQEMAKYAKIPVINGLSDREHPCQVYADILTMKEKFGKTEGLRIAWIGDGNNVCASLLLASSLTGFEVNVASPPGYLPNEDVMERAEKEKSRFSLCETPFEAVKGADVIYTDTWVSMGEEKETAERLSAFKGYTVNSDLVAHAVPEAVVMHCLPAHRGDEITDDVIEGPRSIVWDQAENRMHAQKALLLMLIRGIGCMNTS